MAISATHGEMKTLENRKTKKIVHIIKIVRKNRDFSSKIKAIYAYRKTVIQVRSTVTNRWSRKELRRLCVVRQQVDQRRPARERLCRLCHLRSQPPYIASLQQLANINNSPALQLRSFQSCTEHGCRLTLTSC